MAHLIPEYDADPHFSIDQDTRELIYESEVELTFIQGDHNSKRLTFELPRYIDWHDISLCNKVRVHFINISAEDQSLRVEDAYDVDDLRLCPDDEENTVVCSWLVSQRATTHVGNLNFIVSFSVVDENSKEIEYSWNTAVYADIPVRECYDHGGFIAVKYADILEEWHQKLIDDSTSGVNAILEAQNKALDILEEQRIYVKNTVDESKSGALSALNDTKTEALNKLAESKTEALDSIGNARDETINLISEYGGIAVSETEPENEKIGFWIQDIPEDQQETIELLTKNDIAGVKDLDHNSEIFNDYNNNIAIGEYSSVHGKSSTNYSSITKPETIYYKALPNTVDYDGKYDFESLQFTTDPTNALGTVDKVYTYKDEWGNTRYTLWQDRHPNWTGVDAGYELLGSSATQYTEPGTYRLKFKPEYMQTEGYNYCFVGYTSDVFIVEECVYADGNNAHGFMYPSIVENTSGIYDIEIFDYSYEQDNDDGNDSYEEISHNRILNVGVENIVDVYKYVEGTLVGDLVKEVPSDDPIYNTILYEALVNGGKSFSLADGEASTVFGKDNITNGYGAIASGRNSIAAANYSSALGRDTEARGPGAFAVGLGGKATGMYSFAANEKGVASGYASTVFGDHCASTDFYSISGGFKSVSNGSSAIAIGANCKANGPRSAALGDRAKTNGDNALAFGMVTEANGRNSLSIGYNNKANGEYSVALGLYNTVGGAGAAIGESNTIASNGFAVGRGHTVEGAYGSIALGNCNTVTGKNGAAAIGERSMALAESAYAIGLHCKTTARSGVSMGYYSEANGISSFAAGHQAKANGANSIAIGRLTVADGGYQTVIGRANLPLTSNKAVLIVGTGMQDDDRSNGLIVYNDGNVEVGHDPINDMDVVTKQYFDSAIGDVENVLDSIIEIQNGLMGVSE